MEFVVERKGYRENDDDDDEEEEEEDEDEDEEEGEEIGSSISKFPFSSAAAASSSSKAYSNDYSKRQIGDQYCEERSYIHEIEARSGDGVGWMREREREREGDDHREHMFDKVVTPSDVGKLNRLVIPKQHAEKYFPLHSSSSSSSGSEKSGALLDFEDRNGKQWRFRYSYWNSSQSYVMTKGWSRFVKEKKLDAGDIVSFHRCSLISSSSSSTTVAGGGGDDELGGRSYKDKYRLFIDWRHRSPIQQVPVPVPVHVPHPLPYGAWGGYNHNHNHNHNHHHNHHMTQLMNYNQFKPYLFDHHHRHGYCPQQRSVDDLYNSGGANNIHELQMKNMGATAAGSIYYLTPSEEACRRLINMGNHNDHTVINSVPVLHPMNPPPPPPPPPSTSTHSSSPKRLRLFGVNMEEHCCPILQTDHHHQYQHQHQHVLPSVPYFTMPSSTNINVSHLPNAASTSYLPAAPLSSSSSSTTTTTTTTLPKSRNTTSLSFDLHLSDSH